MEFVKNEKYVSERIEEYSRNDDFPIEGELLVTITLNEYRRLVERLAESRVYNNEYTCKIKALKEEIESLEEKCSNLERQNEALVEAIKENEAHE